MASHTFLLYIFLLVYFALCRGQIKNLKQDLYSIKVSDFVYWPNATIPFYINTKHFDKEQSTTILSTLSLFAFKTCLQFKPVVAEPGLNQHVMLFENPDGVKQCVIGLEGHAKEEPHRIVLGYDCLKSPKIDMLLMKALGFPFEHNRVSRDIYVDIQFENIDVGSMILFTKQRILPAELRTLPYDVDSVMHFDERDFSKNGHRTIIFKGKKTSENRVGLSNSDLRKIDIVYGPECLKRERQAKIDLCKNYPAIRRKRSIDLTTVGSLRVNPDITPPPDVTDERNLTDEVTNNLKELGIENEVQGLIDQIHKITATALENSKLKHCNVTNNNKNDRKLDENEKSTDLTEIIGTVDRYVASVVHNAVLNLTIFCDNSSSLEIFQRVRCNWGGNNCPVNYRSTKSGRPKYSTQHRPIIKQSTKHEGRGKKIPYINIRRTENDTEVISNLTRRKRDTEANKVENITKATEVTTKMTPDVIVKDDLRMATKIIKDNKVNYAPVRRNFKEYVSRNEENEDGSNMRGEKRIKKKPKGRIHRPKEEIIEIEIKSNRENEKSRDKKYEGYTDNIEKEERKRDKKKRIKKERIGSQTPRTVKISKENENFYKERIWPGGVVNYVIQENSNYDLDAVRARLEEVNKILKLKTCVHLQEISGEPGKDDDYLILDTNRDYVTGRVGGKQNFGSLELFEGGQHRQHAAMMVMAMLGFYFEISRHDRDKHIRIHNRHIRPDKLHHFEKIRSDATLPLPYDYKSATHPAWQFWRKVGKTGIATVATYKDQDPDGSIMKLLGQNTQLLSDNDIIKINTVYGVKCFKNQRRMKLRQTPGTIK